MEQLVARDWPFKLLILFAWADGSIDWIHRQDNRFKIETQPLSKRYGKTMPKVRNGFRSLERMGYIFNLRFECGRVLFYLNLPRWLTVSEEAKITEGIVPPFICKGARECDSPETNMYK